MTDSIAGIDLIVVAPIGAGLVITLVTGLVLWRIMKRREARDRAALDEGSAPDAAGDVEFPIRGAHTRPGFLQGAHSSNSINPRFWVEREAVRIKILSTWHLPFHEILQIDAREPMTGMALIFQIAAGHRAFVVRFGHAQLAREALARIARSVPLTTAAATLRDGDAHAATPNLKPYLGPLR